MITGYYNATYHVLWRYSVDCRITNVVFLNDGRVQTVEIQQQYKLVVKT